MAEIIDEPMRQLVLTMSAWRRLKAEAVKLKNDDQTLGHILLYHMGKAWDEAEKDLKDSEKSLRKQMKEALK